MEDDIAEKLRRENPEQFFILVRMHLSFIIDMNTDEIDSPTDKPKSFKWGFSKKVKNESSTKTNLGPSKNVEVFLLNEENVNQLYQLIDILSDDKNVCQEGIFRRTGSLSRQQQLRKFLNVGGVLCGDDSEELIYSVHDMASVLKGILADTPEPLLLNQNYQAYCHLAASNFNDGQLANNCESRLIDALRLLLLLLPALDRCLARRLLVLLHQTSLQESSNRMSPTALSTMFSPHVMCPRRLSPESLHTDSQILGPILSFMIQHAPVLFTTPPQLSADISAYLSRRQQRKLLSPNGEDLNESVSERTAASTIFTFVDRQMSGAVESESAKATTSSTTTTDAALAQLYAHIQALPESQNKRRLIKQFNRENGNGTPLQLQRAQKQKSLGHSLKKHIFNKSLMSKTVKKSLMLQEQGFNYRSIIESPVRTPCPTTSAVECTLSETPKLTKVDVDVEVSPVKILEKSPEINKTPERNELLCITATPRLIRQKLDNHLMLTSTPQVTNRLIAAVDIAECSTPIFSNNHIMRRGSMSPITKSTQKMPKAMQESIMTPRSRKPVIINCDMPISSQKSDDKENNRSSSNNACESSLSSSTISSSSRSIKNDSDFVSTDESCPSTSYCIKYKPINSAESSKIATKTLSAPYSNLIDTDIELRKKRIFQESFPENSNRSECKHYSLDRSDCELINDKLLEASDTESNHSLNKNSKGAGLTDAFRQYLLCRSILTQSPIDLSFTNEPNNDVNNDVNIENVSDDKLTTSMLYFLNGNAGDVSEPSKGHNTCSDSFINKENVSPTNKRVQKSGDDNGSLNKTENKRKKKIKAVIDNNLEWESFEMSDHKDFINNDTRTLLRETNL